MKTAGYLVLAAAGPGHTSVVYRALKQEMEEEVDGGRRRQ